MRGRYRRGFGVQAFLLRIALVSLPVILVLSLLAPTAFARTYVITDGDRTVTYTSFADDPAQVLNEAGLALEEEDVWTTEAVEGGSAINIRRAQSITIEYHGQTTKTTTFATTAGELLEKLKMDVSGEDVVSHGMEEMTYDGMVLRVDEVVTLRETYAIAVPHDVSRCDDPTLPEGVERVLEAGAEGELLCTADVTYVNGLETARKILSQDQTRAPVTRVIARGTGEAPQPAQDQPVIRDGYITLPTGEVLTYYKTDTVRATAYTHTDDGCDDTTATGTTVRWGTVAVDPRYIPYGTRMFIVASDGSYVYGIATAEDCGGAIKGDRMDLYMPTYEQCMDFGRRRCTLYFLD